MSETTTAVETATKKTRNTTGRRTKRRIFKMPERVPVPVRGLWEAATAEEQKKAHEASVAILSMWLGQMSRVEVAKQLEVKPLRVWQMSQQALAGMVAGLLKQPKGRPSQEVRDLLKPHENITHLKATITRLEKKLGHMETLVDLLRQMPGAPIDGQGKGVSHVPGASPPRDAAKNRKKPHRNREAAKG